MIGIEEREHNGIKILRLHYTADPARRSPEWKMEAKRGMSSRDWEREEEINWTIASGLPVYGDDFVREWHVAKEPLLAYRNRPIYRGWDFGLTPSCVWGQVDPQGRFNWLAELATWTGKGGIKQQGIDALASNVVLISNQDYPGAQFIDYADPAGWAKAQTDERSCVEIMQQKGIHPRQGPVTFTARKHAMVQMLTRAVGGRAALMLSPDCKMLIEGFGGAYRYEEVGETGRFKETVEKNAWSHPMNAAEYVIGALYVPQREERERERRRPGKRNKVTGY